MFCFICKKPRNVKKFEDSTLNKCLNILAYRKDKKFKYGDLCLDRAVITDDCGYHYECYRKFTTLKQKDQEELKARFSSNESSNTSASTGTQTDENAHNIPGTSSAERHDDNRGNDVTSGDIVADVNIKPSTSKHADEDLENVAEKSEKTTTSTPSGLETVNPEASLSANTPSPMETEDITLDSSDTQKKKKDRVLPCIFCCIRLKKTVPTIICPTEGTHSNIRMYALGLQDEKVLNDMQLRETIAYHPVCYSTYRSKYLFAIKKSENPKESVLWHETREIHKSAFKSISEFIEDEIIDREKVYFLSDIYATFKSLLIEFGNGVYSKENIDGTNISAFANKILQSYGDRVAILASETPLKQRIVYKIDIDIRQLVQDKLLHESSDTTKLQQAAFEIRNSVKNIEIKKIPQDVKVDNIIEGECEIPELLFEFICNVIQGPGYRRKNSDFDYTKIKSLCSDIIYAINKGRVKPSKQLMLGLAIKSLTNCKKVLNILNRYGHTISYSAAEELETEMTFTEYQNSTTIPAGMSKAPGLCTHVAYDNFDRFVDTFSGKDTLHDTVGIIYQFRSPVLPSDAVSLPREIPTTSDGRCDETSSTNQPTSRKRRKFSEIPTEIENCPKPTDNNVPLVPYNTIKDLLHDFQFAVTNAATKNVLWALSFSQLPDIPMWIGFNSFTTIDDSEMQIVDYLSPINRSPTSHDVVNLTLKNAANIAHHCDQPKIIVTYDLAIAKMAMVLQHKHSPKYNNIFINMGAFHLQMAYFKAIGKYIDSCGITDILVQSEVLAGGSINSLLDSKHFNRCKRLHPQVSVALQTLHLERFLSENEVSPEVFVEDLNAAVSTPVGPEDNLNISPGMRDFLDQYLNFRNATLAGAHGKTAQFYMKYVELINAFFNLSRSIRTSNFELYVSSIFDIADLFFVLNQQNYARWSIKYVSNLVTLKTTNSDLLDDFKRGAFGVKRTSGILARAPVDLTLEQTINGDAANTLTGISHLTNSISARQRWAISHSMRTKIITKVLEDVGITRGDDVSYELKRNRIEKDRGAVAKIIDAIKLNLNPFDCNVDPNSLFHITTGKAASPSVTEFLLNAKELGAEKKVQFIKECEKDELRFSRALKRQSVKNFASESIKLVQKSRDGNKQALIAMERDVFGRLLAIAVEKKVDIAACLSYPLAPAPPAFSQYNGDMYGTEKSALGRILKSCVDSVPPVIVDTDIIDGFYLLHIIGATLPESFGKLSEAILFKICNTRASEIHLVFDRYFSPSIKDCERGKRDEQDVPYNIIGPHQRRPIDFLKSLRNRKFKESLVSFLSQHWANDSVAPILQGKKVFITVEERCLSYEVIDNHVVTTDEIDYTCYHEEADTRIIFHISKAKPTARVVVKVSDTDVLVILLGNIHKFPQMKLWIMNIGSKASEDPFIDCSKLASVLGSDLCKALPGFHAFTGCDYTAAFFRKGKIRPYKMLQKSKEYQRAFAALQDKADMQDEFIVDTLQEFTAKMYSIKKCKRVDSARFEIFQKLYSGQNSSDAFIKKVKGFDCSLIPPCYRSLEQKILRTIFVTNMWQNATLPNCTTLNLEEYGWQIVERKVKPFWFRGQPTPLLIDDILSLSKDDDDEDKDLEVSPLSFDSDDDTN